MREDDSEEVYCITQLNIWHSVLFSGSGRNTEQGQVYLDFEKKKKRQFKHELRIHLRNMDGKSLSQSSTGDVSIGNAIGICIYGKVELVESVHSETVMSMRKLYKI